MTIPLKKCREFLNKTNLLCPEFFALGLYRIICLKNNKIYIGESSCCLERIGQHLSDLMGNRHRCKPLQNDFNKYGIAYFEARIICSGDEWKKLKTRLLEEMYLSTNIGVDNIYSMPKKRKDLLYLYPSYKKDEPFLLTKTSNFLNQTHFFCEAFNKPGLYQITCLKNNKKYIGETKEFLSRLLGHLIDLKRKAHSCADFQKEYNESNVFGFSAVVIDYGDKWQKVGDRLEEELRLCKII